MARGLFTALYMVLGGPSTVPRMIWGGPSILLCMNGLGGGPLLHVGGTTYSLHDMSITFAY